MSLVLLELMDDSYIGNISAARPAIFMTLVLVLIFSTVGLVANGKPHGFSMQDVQLKRVHHTERIRVH